MLGLYRRLFCAALLRTSVPRTGRARFTPRLTALDERAVPARLIITSVQPGYEDGVTYVNLRREDCDTTGPLAVPFTIDPGPVGVDFTVQSFAFSAGADGDAQIQLIGVPDSTPEADRMPVITFGPIPGFDELPGPTVAPVWDDDRLPTVVVSGGGGVAENGGSGGFSLTRVTNLSGPRVVNQFSTMLVVPWSLSGTATPGTDYTGPTSGTVTIYPYQSSVSAGGFTAKADNLREGPETVVMTVGAGSGYTAGPPVTATIVDELPVVSIAPGDAASELGATAYTVTSGFLVLRRSGGDLSQPFSVPVTFDSSDDYATEGTDYTAPHTVTFPAHDPANGVDGTTAHLFVTPKKDNVIEDREVVRGIVTVPVPGSSNYQLDGSGIADLDLEDDLPSVSATAIWLPQSDRPLIGHITIVRQGGDLSQSLRVNASNHP